MILFEDIFNRAVNLFDDPDIQRAYELNPVEFSKTMRPYLINGLGMFANPTTVSSRFSDYTEAQGKLEVLMVTVEQLIRCPLSQQTTLL